MIDLRELDKFRVNDPRIGWTGDQYCGAFEIPVPMSKGYRLDKGSSARCVVSSGYGWDHVSVSVSGRQRCPTWEEMEFIRRKFFLPDEPVMQYHAPVADYVDGTQENSHPFVLHLWRPFDVRCGVIPKPPKFMVGGMSSVQADREARALEAIGLGWR